ncbi:MAG: hypothetical protein QME46_02795 [Thermoanaerobacteraceae bacterium]|nr:hypothetical protein [Thermoanaerobacteraceae bacterium]
MDNVLKEKVKLMIDEIPEDRITEVIDFIEFIKQKEEKEENEATDEILNDKNLMASLKRGLEDIEKGNIYSFEDVFKNV